MREILIGAFMVLGVCTGFYGMTGLIAAADLDDERRGAKACVGCVLAIIFCFAALALMGPDDSQARVSRPPIPPAVFKAVRAEWHARVDRVKAFDVIACETGDRYNTTARNGQYLGLFQMGSWARSRFGHGDSARAQAHAAHSYWRVSGWSPWECA